MSTESAPIAQSPTPASFHPYSITGSNPLTFEKRHALFQASVVFIDAAILLCSTYAVYRATLSSGSLTLLGTLGVVVGTWLLMLQLNGLYNPKITRPAYQLAYDLIKTSGMSILANSAIFFLIPPLSIPREVHWISALLAGTLLLLWRIVGLHVFPIPHIKKRAIFVGPAESGRQLADEIQHHPDSGYEMVGFIDRQDDLTPDSTNLLLGYDIDLPQVVRNYRINSIIVPSSAQLPDSTLRSISDCSELGCELISTSHLYERVTGRIPVQHISHMWFISELDASERLAYRSGKRFLDVLLSAIGLLATGLLFPLIALLIKLDSPGPIFYSQIRSGKNGHPFRIYKFRSMVHNAEKTGAVWAKVNDNRITKLGLLLRKTRLDELPQLYNVLLGEMSLVGPRPERPEFIEQLAKEIPFFTKRQLVLPGLTGWAQVKYPYGSSTSDALEKLQYDLYYIKNRSMFLDLEILFRTISVVIKKQGR